MLEYVDIIFCKADIWLLLAQIFQNMSVLIYIGLLLFWIQSVRRRLLPSRARNYALLSALLMIIYLCLRAFKYQITESVVAKRYTWYAYYIPMALIPTLFLMLAIYILRDSSKRNFEERLLLIPVSVLITLFITNDIHKIVFKPRIPLSDFVGDTGTYGYGITFYIMYAWIILSLAAGIVLMIKESGFRRSPHTILPFFIIFIWLIMLMVLEGLEAAGIRIHMYQGPEIHIFSLLAVYESCIRLSLIPHNENYEGFFESLRMPVIITDKNLEVVYRSDCHLEADREELTHALKAPFYISDTERLFGNAVQGGYVFYISDENEIILANERLQAANELLESENTLIEYENRQKEEAAYIRSRHHIYHDVAEEIYTDQKRIGDLLEKIEPGCSDFKERVAYITVLNAYMKRKTNILLLAAESEAIDRRELYLAINESVRYMKYIGIKASVRDYTHEEECPTANQVPNMGGHSEEQSQEGAFDSDILIDLYDTFEQVVEQLIGRACLMMITLTREGFRMTADAKLIPKLHNPRCTVRTDLRDDILFLEATGMRGGDL